MARNGKPQKNIRRNVMIAQKLKGPGQPGMPSEGFLEMGLKNLEEWVDLASKKGRQVFLGREAD